METDLLLLNISLDKDHFGRTTKFALNETAWHEIQAGRTDIHMRNGGGLGLGLRQRRGNGREQARRGQKKRNFHAKPPVSWTGSVQ